MSTALTFRAGPSGGHRRTSNQGAPENLQGRRGAEAQYMTKSRTDARTLAGVGAPAVPARPTRTSRRVLMPTSRDCGASADARVTAGRVAGRNPWRFTFRGCDAERSDAASRRARTTSAAIISAFRYSSAPRRRPASRWNENEEHPLGTASAGRPPSFVSSKARQLAALGRDARHAADSRRPAAAAVRQQPAAASRCFALQKPPAAAPVRPRPRPRRAQRGAPPHRHHARP